MKVVVVDGDPESRSKICISINRFENFNVLQACGDLTAAFNTIEHMAPDLVLFSERFTSHDEFETMEVLCRCLHVRTAVYTDKAIPTNSAVFSLAAPLAQIKSYLEAISRKDHVAPPRASVGLFKSNAKDGVDGIALIGASTGGIDALITVLGSFPVDCPPTLIVQHTGKSFTAGLIRLLDSRVEPKVRMAKDGEKLERGVILMAPDSDVHLGIEGRENLRCKLIAAPPVSGHRPSVDVLFESAAQVADRAVATILTGMGRDGAQGLKKLKAAGAHTIGQDEKTSVVYGMPRAAAELGAVKQTLPLPLIGPAVLKSCNEVRRA